MTSREEFAQRLAEFDLQHAERAIALLWFYRQSQEYDERSASDLANDLHEEGFPKPNVTRLESDLRRSTATVPGQRKGTFQIDIRKLSKLDEAFYPLLDRKDVSIDDTILPSEWVIGTRKYLEELVLQINGSYQFGFFDCSAVLCRRLMESLIIEVYISQGRQLEIQTGGVFYNLEKLITCIRSDPKIVLSRNSPSTMSEIKQLGDTAAHDRTYITPPNDIDEIKTKYRRLITELLTLSNIKK